MNYLSLEEILRLHFQIVEDFGGSHGVRDEGRLISVVNVPSQVVFGQEQYKTVFDKAAVYIRNIIADHAFIDANKRTAITAGAIFIMRTEHQLIAKPQELEDFAVRVATDHLDIAAIASWLEGHSN
jgi:death-on-curing protein